MKLNIDVEELARLLKELQNYALKAQKTFKKAAATMQMRTDNLLFAWLAASLEQYSLCALTLEEFMVEVKAGRKCNVEDVTWYDEKNGEAH